MTSVPGRIKADMQVGIDRPRSIQAESTREFLDLRMTIWNLIRKEVENSITGDNESS
jgi:ABC-type nitrate/sulfonate/bicarbonate transport system ATPase subunit